jgi:hypothetical protein
MRKKKILTPVFEAPDPVFPDRGFTVALLPGDEMLIGIVDQTGVHACTLPRSSAFALVMALCVALAPVADETEMALFRKLVDEQWAEAPKA